MKHKDLDCEFSTKMHQQYQLPPRPPFPRKETTRRLNEAIKIGGNNKAKGHKKSFSQGSILEDQPPWLDDLLNDSVSNTRGSHHSRSSSDPMAALYDDDGVFSPNSPRRGVDVELGILEEGYGSHEHGSFGSTNNLNGDKNQGKRHLRQRSRVRKLHYIAELDKKVTELQALVSELQQNVSALLQQRLILTVENTQLKQYASELQQQKLVLNDEYQTLSKEADRLKSGLARVHAKSGMNYKGSDYNWEMLDWRKLDLG